VSDKLREITILSLDEGSYRFFSDIANISCEPLEGVEGHYSNCSNKEHNQSFQVGQTRIGVSARIE
jgi:hypothetical protein